MTRNDLINLGEHKVRRNEDLMLFYLKEFEIMFGRKPVCAGCTFKRDWNNFVKGKNRTFRQNIIKMEKTFKLKNSELSKIHTYVDSRPRRTYGSKMTEQFAIEYLKNNKDASSKFDVLPKVKEIVVVNVSDIDVEKKIILNGEEILLSKAKGKEIDAYAELNDIDFGDATKVKDKKEVLKKVL